jgi:hypothetical protein
VADPAGAAAREAIVIGRTTAAEVAAATDAVFVIAAAVGIDQTRTKRRTTAAAITIGTLAAIVIDEAIRFSPTIAVVTTILTVVAVTIVATTIENAVATTATLVVATIVVIAALGCGWYTQTSGTDISPCTIIAGDALRFSANTFTTDTNIAAHTIYIGVTLPRSWGTTGVLHAHFNTRTIEVGVAFGLDISSDTGVAVEVAGLVQLTIVVAGAGVLNALTIVANLLRRALGVSAALGIGHHTRASVANLQAGAIGIDAAAVGRWHAVARGIAHLGTHTINVVVAFRRGCTATTHTTKASATIRIDRAATDGIGGTSGNAADGDAGLGS